MPAAPAYNLHHAVIKHFPADLRIIGAISMAEEEANLVQLISVAVPVVLLAFIRKASCATNAAGIWFLGLSARKNQALKTATDYYFMKNSAIHQFGAELLPELMGDKLTPITHMIARNSCTKSSSVRTVLEFTCCISLLAVGEYIHTHNLDNDEFRQWLAGQEVAVLQNFPHDFNSVAVSFNVSNTSNGKFNVQSVYSTGKKRPGEGKWYRPGKKPLLIIVLFILLFVFWLVIMMGQRLFRFS